MQPQPFHEKHLIFKPTRPASSARAPIQVGGSQAVGVGRDMMALGGQGDLFYLHLVRDLVSVIDDQTNDSGDGGDGDVVMGEGETENEKKTLPATTVTELQEETNTAVTKWTLQFRDIPEAGNRRPVTLRLMADTPITAGDPMAFMKAMEYTHISTHHLQGHRWTQNNISLILIRPLLSSGNKNSRPLDPSGAYLLTASIKVQDGTKPEQISRGVRELVALKDTLKGSIDLEPADRLALDTRVK
ncbi:MAG: hypothetical protein Q9167_003263 [Letrouitia subvulpina]